MEIEIESLDVLNITIRMQNGESKEFNLADELSINKFDINEDFINQPGRYAWWAAVAETAKAQKEHSSNVLERAEAQADYSVRLKLELEGTKITEAQVKHGIRLEVLYQKALESYNLAKKNSLTLDKFVKAFDQRLESMISIGANLRKEEGNAEVTMKDLQSRAKNVTNR